MEIELAEFFELSLSKLGEEIVNFKEESNLLRKHDGINNFAYKLKAGVRFL
jgi:hypothetical protein